MPEPFGSPRKIDLNLPIDYFSRSTTKFVEWLDLAGSILAEPMQPLNGQVTGRGPGLGIDWDEKAIHRYTV